MAARMLAPVSCSRPGPGDVSTESTAVEKFTPESVPTTIRDHIASCVDKAEHSPVKVWQTRLEYPDLDLRMKGLLPLDRRILKQVGRNLTQPGSVDYTVQIAAMTIIDAQIMLERTRCPASTPVAKSVALRIIGT